MHSYFFVCFLAEIHVHTHVLICLINILVWSIMMFTCRTGTAVDVVYIMQCDWHFAVSMVEDIAVYL